MANLETSYAGLTLKNPLIVSSSGLTSNIKSIQKLIKSNPGAVVLKSLFEEQIVKDSFKETTNHPEEYDYLMKYNTHEYLNLIKESKALSDIPIIASINCISKTGWTEYAQAIEQAGACALELNIMIFPEKEFSPTTPFEQWFYNHYPFKTSTSSTRVKSSDEVERNIYEIVKDVKLKLKIPVIVKLGPYFTSINNLSNKLDSLVDGLVLFNHFYTPDFDIHTGEMKHKIHFSHPEQMYNTLRWITLIAPEINCDLSASTGIHSANSCIKMLMAGASSVQLCSIIYKQGPKIIEKFTEEIGQFMDEQRISSIKDLKGSLKQTLDKTIFSRMQYMKMYCGHN